MTDPVVPAREVLIVQSKVRDEIRKKNPEARVSDDFLKSLNDEVYTLIDRAIKRCFDNNRKTLGKADV